VGKSPFFRENEVRGNEGLDKRRRYKKQKDGIKEDLKREETKDVPGVGQPLVLVLAIRRGHATAGKTYSIKPERRKKTRQNIGVQEEKGLGALGPLVIGPARNNQKREASGQ